jgi:Domain of unknown function (DUF6457)
VNEWLAKQADALEVSTLTADEEEAILGLAAFAAHESGARTNAPLLCFLLGRSGKSLDELAEIVRSTS